MWPKAPSYSHDGRTGDFNTDEARSTGRGMQHSGSRPTQYKKELKAYKHALYTDSVMTWQHWCITVNYTMMVKFLLTLQLRQGFSQVHIGFVQYSESSTVLVFNPLVLNPLFCDQPVISFIFIDHHRNIVPILASPCIEISSTPVLGLKVSLSLKN